MVHGGISGRGGGDTIGLGEDGEQEKKKRKNSRMIYQQQRFHSDEKGDFPQG